MQTDIKKTIKIINEISSSACAAKWYNATIWLGNGRTASCHLPPAHSILLEGLDSNPSLLHNTEFKKQRRDEMLKGIRPHECSYCWTIEDTIDKDVYSDRIYKSRIYNEDQLYDLKTIGLNDTDPLTLEISFDNLCNLSCSYCNSEFSSTWASDIKSNGRYPDMLTTGGMTYYNDGSHAMPYGTKNQENPYVEAFFKWFRSSLKHSLIELRVTGGEPTRSPDFWKLIDECHDVKFQFAVNSNLMMDSDKLDKLIEATHKFKKFDLYTSCESVGKHAEFIRSGLCYQTWYDNLVRFSNEARYGSIHIMLTISALSVWKITEFMDQILNLRKQINKNQFYMSINILRFPSFQSINVLPDILKKKQAEKIKVWLSSVDGLTSIEKNQIERLEIYLRNVSKSYEDIDDVSSTRKDLKTFINEYSNRNNFRYKELFDIDFTDWIESI